MGLLGPAGSSMVRNFMIDYFKAHPIKREDIPVIGNKPVDLTKLFREVYGMGGFEKVSFTRAALLFSRCFA